MDTAEQGNNGSDNEPQNKAQENADYEPLGWAGRYHFDPFYKPVYQSHGITVGMQPSSLTAFIQNALRAA